MAFRSTVSAVLVAAAALTIALPFMAPAQNEGAPAAAGAPVGDAARGQKLAYTCYGCHGIESYKNVYPTYSVPKLQGQHPEYLVLALQAYRSGERSHTTMHSHAAGMSDQDMRDIATYLSSKSLVSKPSTAGAKVPKAVELCATCHGPDGVGITPQYPNLAGQHADYIERALHDYKNGARKNPIMAPMAAQLNEKDIKEVAAYFSKQRPSLSTAAHANWFGGMDKKHSK